jgi:hypothetical protein
MAIFFRLLPFLLLISITCNQANADYLEQVAKEFKPLSGYVVLVEKGEIIIDHGAKSGVRIGDLFAVVVPGKKIINPVTGKVLGTLEKARAVLKVTRLKPAFSYVRAIRGEDTIDIGDIIRRFESMKALFWDYSGQGEYMYAGLQNLLPGLNWISYDEAQRSKPEGKYLKAQIDADIIFINTSESLEVRDSKFMLVRQYGPPTNLTFLPKKPSTFPKKHKASEAPPAKTAKKSESFGPKTPKISKKDGKSALKAKTSEMSPKKVTEIHASKPDVEKPEIYDEPSQPIEPTPDVGSVSAPEISETDIREESEDQSTEPQSENPESVIEPPQPIEPTVQTIPEPIPEDEKSVTVPALSEDAPERASENQTTESQLEEPEVQVEPSRPIVPDAQAIPEPNIEDEKPVTVPEPFEADKEEEPGDQSTDSQIEKPEAKISPFKPIRPTTPESFQELEKPATEAERSKADPKEAIENHLIETPETFTASSLAIEPVAQPQPAPLPEVEEPFEKPESSLNDSRDVPMTHASETDSEKAPMDQSSDTVVEEPEAVPKPTSTNEPVSQNDSNLQPEVEKPIAALAPSISFPVETPDNQPDKHTGEGFHGYLEPPFKQEATSLEIDGTLMTIADFIFASDQTLMVATDGFQINIYVVADKSYTKLHGADMPYSPQILSVQWWQPESMGALYVVVVSWSDNKVSSEILKFTQTDLEPVFSKRSDIFGVFDTDGDSRPESLFIQEFIRETFFGETVQAVVVNGNKLVYEDLAIDFPDEFTILGSRLVDLTGDSNLETVYIRRGFLYVYCGKELTYRSSKRMGGSQSMLTYVPDSQNAQAGTKTVVFEIPPLVADFDDDGLPEIWSVATEKSILGYDSSGYRVRKSGLTEIKYLNGQFVEKAFGESFKGPIQGLGYSDRTGYVMYWNRIHFLSGTKTRASRD